MVAAAAAAAARAGTAAKGAKAAKGAGAAKASTKRAPRSGRADRSGAATASDVAQLRSQAAAGDQLTQQAYQAGQDATAWEDLVVDVQQAPGARQAYEQGLAERQGRLSSAVDTGRRAAGQVAGVRGPGFVNDGAGFVLGLLLYALALNFLQGGPTQAKAWVAAKFINKPFRGAKRIPGPAAKPGDRGIGRVER